MDTRDKKIMQTSIIGIVANIILVVFKLTVGFISNSTAIILDAINNLTDALSCVITIIGTKLSNKKPDKKHPYGYGRIEYMSSILISFLIIFFGITSFTESFKKILHPTETNYQVTTLIVLIGAVIVKIILGTYTKKVGEKINSNSLIASGTDATFDAVISMGTIVSLVVVYFFDINIDGYVSLIISVAILKAGFEVFMTSTNSILGERIDSTLSRDIKKIAREQENVLGAYDLIVHNYGNDKMIGSMHIEVYDYLNAKEINVITKKIQYQVAEKYNIFLTIGIYSINTKNDEIANTESAIRKVVLENKDILQLHGFYCDTERKIINFDILVNFNVFDTDKLTYELLEKLKTLYNDYKFYIAVDKDYAD